MDKVKLHQTITTLRELQENAKHQPAIHKVYSDVILHVKDLYKKAE